MEQKLEQLDLFPHSLGGTNVVFDKHSFTREFIEGVEIINKDDPVNKATENGVKGDFTTPEDYVKNVYGNSL